MSAEIKGDGEIRQKLKQARFRHLKREIESRLRLTAKNCVHNIPLEVRGAEVGFCALKHIVCDVAEKKDHAPSCPNFGLRASKDEIKADFQALMESPIHEIATKYPDVAALTWVVGKEEPTDFLPGSTLVGSVKGVLLWADTEGEAESAKSEIANLVEASAAVLNTPKILDGFEDHIDTLAQQVQESASSLDLIEVRVAALHDEIEAFRQDILAANGLAVSKPSLWSWLRSVLPWG